MASNNIGISFHRLQKLQIHIALVAPQFERRHQCGTYSITHSCHCTSKLYPTRLSFFNFGSTYHFLVTWLLLLHLASLLLWGPLCIQPELSPFRSCERLSLERHQVPTSLILLFSQKSRRGVKWLTRHPWLTHYFKIDLEQVESPLDHAPFCFIQTKDPLERLMTCSNQEALIFLVRPQPERRPYYCKALVVHYILTSLHIS